MPHTDSANSRADSIGRHASGVIHPTQVLVCTIMADNDSPAKRRTLHFDSMDEIVRDVESLAQGEVTTTGAYSFGQILEHLARTLDIVTGFKPAPAIPFPVKIFGRLVRNSVINKPPKPGFKLPQKAQSVFWPSEPVSLEEGLTHFREAMRRFKNRNCFPDILFSAISHNKITKNFNVAIASCTSALCTPKIEPTQVRAAMMGRVVIDSPHAQSEKFNDVSLANDCRIIFGIDCIAGRIASLTGAGLDFASADWRAKNSRWTFSVEGARD